VSYTKSQSEMSQHTQRPTKIESGSSARDRVSFRSLPVFGCFTRPFILRIQQQYTLFACIRTGFHRFRFIITTTRLYLRYSPDMSEGHDFFEQALPRFTADDADELFSEDLHDEAFARKFFSTFLDPGSVEPSPENVRALAIPFHFRAIVVGWEPVTPNEIVAMTEIPQEATGFDYEKELKFPLGSVPLLLKSPEFEFDTLRYAFQNQVSEILSSDPSSCLCCGEPSATLVATSRKIAVKYEKGNTLATLEGGVTANFVAYPICPDEVCRKNVAAFMKRSEIHPNDVGVVDGDDDEETQQSVDADDEPVLLSCALCGKDENDGGTRNYRNGTVRFKECARCRVVCYCSRACEKSHWKDHKKDCKKFSKMASSK